MSDDDRIKQIEARLAAATPGPWVDFGPEWGAVYAVEPYGPVCQDPESDDRPADRALIANAPEDLRYLLDEVKRRRAATPYTDARSLAEQRDEAEAEVERLRLALTVALTERDIAREDRECAKAEERARIVAWLRAEADSADPESSAWSPYRAADAIEAGFHIQEDLEGDPP